jgi:hypothetical protein
MEFWVSVGAWWLVGFIGAMVAGYFSPAERFTRGGVLAALIAGAAMGPICWLIALVWMCCSLADGSGGGAIRKWLDTPLSRKK